MSFATRLAAPLHPGPDMRDRCYSPRVSRVLTIVCVDAVCRLQPKPRQIEEGPDANGAGQ